MLLVCSVFDVALVKFVSDGVVSVLSVPSHDVRWMLVPTRRIDESGREPNTKSKMMMG